VVFDDIRLWRVVEGLFKDLGGEQGGLVFLVFCSLCFYSSLGFFS